MQSKEGIQGILRRSSNHTNNDLIPLVSHSNSFLLSQGFVQYPSLIESITNIESVGLLLDTYYFYFFIIASLLLLVAIIGAIV